MCVCVCVCVGVCGCVGVGVEKGISRLYILRFKSLFVSTGPLHWLRELRNWAEQLLMWSYLAGNDKILTVNLKQLLLT